MNSMRRGAPVPVAPVFRMLVILPKLEDETLPEGLPHCGLFNRLNADARKFKPRRSVRRKRFCKPVSIS